MKQWQTTHIAWRFRLAARQFITEPKNWVQTVVSPGSIPMPARQFLGETLETYKNGTDSGDLSRNYGHTIQGTLYMIENTWK